MNEEKSPLQPTRFLATPDRMASEPGYIHGFSDEEAQRLVAQAEILEPAVFAEVDFARFTDVLEIGCAVGAELELLARRHPHLRFSGVDRNPDQIAAAKHLLAPHGERVELHVADASALPFAPASFDLVLCIWLLEHVPNPREILAEALRVLRPDGRLFVMEVDNDTFHTEPEHPVIRNWWTRYSQFQADNGGNPVAGQEVENHIRALGARILRSEQLLPVNSSRAPELHALHWDYAEDLLRSAAPSLQATPEEVIAFERAMEEVRLNGGHIRYGGVRLIAARPTDPTKEPS